MLGKDRVANEESEAWELGIYAGEGYVVRAETDYGDSDRRTCKDMTCRNVVGFKAPPWSRFFLYSEKKIKL